uniref:UDP-galactose/UDP-N-acetylglucosamine transporter srf-3 n=1 Tax=Ascaris suum TaxID=6253 RepID=F1L5U2_ASCSU
MNEMSSPIEHGSTDTSMHTDARESSTEPLLTPSLGRPSLSPQVKMEMLRETSTRTTPLSVRMGILVWLTLQNSVHTLLLRYSRARHVEKMFLSSAAVFFTELLKLLICIVVIIYEERGVTQTFSQILRQVFGNPWDTMKVCIPAMIYTIQNNLFYVGASHLEAATFMVTSQLKIFTTAIFSVIILHKRLSTTQWFALATLFVGVSIVQLQQTSATESTFTQQRPLIGFSAVLVASLLSGFAGIYFEKILKGSAPVSVWMRNVQMAIFAIPSSLLASLVQDWRIISKEGMLYGFDSVVWTTVFWYCIGGLSVAVCIKYADNIAKNFATSVAIIISTIGSVYLFDFMPNIKFLIGTVLVIASIFLYSSSSILLKIFIREEPPHKC